MSTVAIPQHVAPGKLAVDLQLSHGDLRQVIDKLKRAAQELARRRAAAGTGGTTTGAAQPPARPAAPAASAAPTAAAPAAAAPAARPPAQPPALAPAARPVAPPGPLPAFVPVPGQAAAAPMPAARPAMPPPQPPPAAPRPVQQPPAYAAPLPPLQQQPAYTAAAAPAASYAAAAPAPAGTAWQLCWSTEAADHNGDPVSALAYLPSIPGLPGGDNHAGWLISSSRALLNLWECSPSGGRGEPALMMMHSQATDYAYAALDADRATQLLFGACIDRSGAEWVTMQSLDVEAGILGFKGKCPMPHPGAQKLPNQNHLQVVSLHSFGAALEGCCAASYGGGIAVWQVGTLSKLLSGGRPTNPRAVWKAHNSKITTLHKSAFRLSLFSGAEDGTVHMWSMREKPSAPAMSWRHSGRIAGVSQVNDHTLVTAAADGRLMVWDLRQSSTPLKFSVPDGKPINRMAVSPFADCVAVATGGVGPGGAGGLHAIDLLDAACHSTPITTAPLRATIASLAWNAATSEVLVGGGPGGSGTISVFRQRPMY